MNILVIGSGGREHAIVWSLAKSANVKEIFVSPGNAGIAQYANCISLEIDQPHDIIDFCKKRHIELVIIGPEAPLVEGLSDHLRNANINVFGPSQAASQLEGSKEFTKYICKTYGIPTASYEAFTDAEQAKAHILEKGTPIVIKADGLAAGKGVVIADTEEQALDAINAMLVDKEFGDASNKIIIEEFLTGEEVSFFALVNNKTAVPFGSAQDHKAVGEGDIGPNTGGMGTFSPSPIMTDSLQEQVMDSIITPLVMGMNTEGIPYNGVLFAGLMITQEGPKLLEVNVRFGDPETQVLMARLKSDLLELIMATCDGTLSKERVLLDDQSAVCVVLAAKGYPGLYHKGTKIKNIVDFDDTIVFHAGTSKDHEGNFRANGGRVLGVTSIGSTLKDAQTKAYQAVDSIDWPDGFCRRDIGSKAIQKLSNAS